MKTSDYTKQSRTAHHRALETLCVKPQGGDGFALWRALRRIESDARDAATAQCNGEAYRAQPFRDDDAWEAFKAEITARVAKVLGAVPAGFFVNGDPRGCALKIDDTSPIPAGLQKDWGGYGLLAAKID